MRGRATCGINRCELITQLHQRKLCPHSDKNLKIRFPPVPQLPIAFSFLPLKKVCSGVIGVFFSLFFLGSGEEGRLFFWQIYTEPLREAQSRKKPGCNMTAQPLAPAKHEVLCSWSKISPAFPWLWCFPQRTKQGGLQAASSQGFSRHDFPARWREVGVIL